MARMSEKICRARYCVPLSIIIVAVHFALWWYVIYPYLIGSTDSIILSDKAAEFGPGYSDTAYLNSEDASDSGVTNYDGSREQNTTPYETTSSSSHEYGMIQSSSVENLRQETRPREIPRHQHRYRHRNHNHRHLYVVRRKKPLNFSSSTTPPPSSYTTERRRILENVNTRTQQPYQQHQQQQQQYPWGSRTFPPRISPSTTVNPTTLLTNFVAHVTTTKMTTQHRSHHDQRQQHKHRHHHQHHSTTPSTTPPSMITPQFRHHHHFEKERNEELQRQREVIEREKERREQERMKQLTEERAKLQLTKEQEQRAQAIYESQQRALKERKEEAAARKKVMEEESRRRQEHERKIQQWNREEQRPEEGAIPRRPPPSVHESNQWHHPRPLEGDQQQQQQQNQRQNIVDQRSQQQKSAETVADPWAHLRQIEEQRSTSYTVAPATRSPGTFSNEIDPFSITSHRIEEASGVWRAHVDHQNLHPNAISHERHHHQHQGHHRQPNPQPIPQPPPQRPSEANTRRKMIEEEKQRQQEYDRRMQEWNRQQQQQTPRQNPTPLSPPQLPQSNEPLPPPLQPQHHHHHTLQGSILPQQIPRHGHHQSHQSSSQNEISNEIAPASAPPANREKRDTAPVIVTALLDIGRGDWFTFTRPYDLYLNYLLDLLKLQNRIIIFGDRQVFEFLEQNKDIIDFDRIQFVELSLDDLPYSRYRNEIKEIMDEEQKNWKTDWEKATKTHPEAINPDYNILVNSKPYLLFNATQISKFESEYFIWIDAGYSHGEKNIIPSILWNPVLPPGRITVIKITPDQDKVTNYAVEHVYRKAWTVMSGGILAGDSSTIDRFHRFYYKTFMDLLDARKTDDDQVCLFIYPPKK
uniref:Uncharacterized protein n=1 Tax=Panagrolaimus superbus TaxID=310955 RepID=A0A914YV41_9BILA